MKTNKLLFYLLPVLLSTLVSCKKFLDVQPLNSVSDDVTIVDKSSAETAVRGMYRALANDGYYGTSFQSIGYLSGDNLLRTGPGTDPSQFISHAVTSDNGTIGSAWNAIYSTINRANYVIAKLPGITDIKLTATEKNQLLGEAYFVRALCYFDLARTWGGVPIVLTPTLSSTDKDGVKRNTLAETYARVLSDLNLAYPLLPTAINRIRATTNTVTALRARYYLYQKDWVNAEANASIIINDATDYKLIAPYNSWWANNVVGTVESVFELSYSATYPNAHRNSWMPPELGGTRIWIPNNAFIALATDPLVGGSRNSLIGKTTAGLYYGTLYYRSPATDPSYIFRIAEIYLIRAEARAQQGGAMLAGAISDLNAVRTRAGLAGTTATTQADILLAIENERRIEFAYEPHRWFDLVRTGRAAAVLNITDPNKLLMPIPLSQIQASKGAIVQNPGY
ncbi:RagB/SusD family nutrient uptake outer membrane protein [Mucilaginibacter sp.]|uniref:RagB/SusD family nutrient uptake outer membrane protein n=1 Tax=Mucilaginibacter sp. TaxID=1882438 RepID=UPI0026179B07|nr:RagB/SusD family nutrient uptake outer membrane protein [Mucilaginibacter sp.]MDB4926409.1 RagB/SusD family nutrient uptake outer membrane protein [Mucilaginibacter sp.]